VPTAAPTERADAAGVQGDKGTGVTIDDLLEAVGGDAARYALVRYSSDSNIDLDKTDTGWNIGAGLMGFLGQLGLRADLRYFKVSGSEFAGVDQSILRSNHGSVVDDQEGLVNANLLSGISFWRGNVGVALRW